MLYAEVVVGERTDVQALTYAVPARIIPYIRVGAKVVVPLRQKKVDGVVVRLIQRVNNELHAKIKDITSIEQQLIGFSPAQIQVIEKLAAHYGASLAEVAYHALAFPSSLTTSSASSPAKKPVFLQAPWLDRQRFYLDIVKKYQGKRRLVFLFPTDQYAESFFSQIGGNQVFGDKLLAAEQRQLTKSLTEKLPVILVGSQKWAFFPLRPGGVLVIDQPDHIGGRQLRRPYMSTKQIGLTRARSEGIQLIFGADLVSVSDYPKKTERSWRFAEKKLPPSQLLILDRRRSPSLLLPNFEQEFAGAAKAARSLLVFTVSKGWARALYCRACGQLVSCPRCGQPLFLITATEFRCRYCRRTGPIPKQCEKGHPDLVLLGEGLAQIKSHLAKLTKEPIVEVSSDTDQLPNKKLIIATEKILSFPEAVFDVAFIASADQLLSGTDPDSVWHLLSILFQLRSRTKRLVVQTHFPDHWVWSAVGSGRTAGWYEAELARRKTYHLPPYGQELAVFGRDSVRQRLEEQASEVIQKIEKSFPGLIISPPRVEKINPREFQLTLELYSQRLLTGDQKKRLRSLLPFSWFVLID